MYVVVIVAFSLVPQGPGLPGGDKLAHFSAYGVMVLLAMPLVSALRWRLMMLGSIVMLGIVLEGLQLLILQREASLLDLVANCLGVIVGTLLWMIGLRFAVARSRAETG
ncbi:MAG: VanZ family protein [Gemmatimonadetes bacterium]|nr:VanZ family protein [Gemmatimonadota bacterium]